VLLSVLMALAVLVVPSLPATADHEPSAQSHDAAGTGSLQGSELVEEQDGLPCFRVTRHLFGLRGAGTYEGRTADGGPVVFRGQVGQGETLYANGPLQVQVENSEVYYHSPFGTHGTDSSGGSACSPSTVGAAIPATFQVFAAEGTVDLDGDEDIDVLTGQAWVYRVNEAGEQVPCRGRGSYARGTNEEPTFGDSAEEMEWTLDEDCVVVGNEAGTPGTGIAPTGTFHTSHGEHDPCFGDVQAGDCPSNIRHQYAQFLAKPGPFLAASGPSSAVIGCERPVTVNALLTVDGVAQPDVAVSFSATGPAPAAPPLGTGTTGPDGRASFTFSAAVPGEYTVTATATYDGQERVATHTVRFDELPPLSISLSGPPTGQTEQATRVRATVRDACGTLAGAPVEFSVAWPAQDAPWTGQATPPSGIVTTDTFGQAEFRFSGDRAGDYTVTASTTTGAEQASATHTANLAINTLAPVDSTPLGVDGASPLTTSKVSAIDPAGDYAYFATGPDSRPDRIVKVDLATFEPVDVLMVPYLGIESLVIDPGGAFAYAAAIGVVVRIDLATFELAGSLALPERPGGRAATPVATVIDPAGDYAYVGTRGSYVSHFRPSSWYTAQVLKIDLDTFALVGTLDMNLEEESAMFAPALMDPSGAFAYFTFHRALGARVVKIDLSTFERVGHVTLDGFDEGEIGSGVTDLAGDFAYYGTTYSNPGRILKVDLRTMTRADAIILNKDFSVLAPFPGDIPIDRSEYDLQSAVRDPAGRFAYFVTSGRIGASHPAARDVPSRIIRIDLSTFTRAASVDLPPTENETSTAVIDPTGTHAYLGTSRVDAAARSTFTPRAGLVAKVRLNRPPGPALSADADAYATGFETPLTVPAPGVLDGDSDTADGDPLVAGQVSDPAGGSVTLNRDGSFTYTPDARFAGTDTFTYTASDGVDYSAPATVSVAVAAPLGPQASAFNYFTNVSLFGGPYSVRGYGQDATAPETAASPSVICPAGGGATSVTDPDGAKAAYGPGVIFGGIWPDDQSVAPPSGPLSSSVDCVAGDAGYGTASTAVGLMPAGSPYPGGVGPGPVIADEAHSTCTARPDGTATVSTTIVNGVLETSYDPNTQLAVTSEPIPLNPPVNYTRSGTIDHVGDRYRVVFNEQITHPDGSRTVNAVHLYLLGPTAVGDMVLGSSTCGVPTTTPPPPVALPPVADFDGNGTSDRSVYRPATGQWFTQGGSPEVVQYGTDGDIPVPGDYDGNRTADRAVYRPSTGQWFVQGGSPEVVQYGATGDIPVPGDYDGNGSTDRAVYRPSTGQWFVQGGNPEVVQYGAAGDIPVPADYDGNGTVDRAIYRPATGQWFVRGGSPEVVQYGAGGDIPVPADYDGNGTAERAIYRPATGQWFVQGGSPEVVQYGAAGDQPLPGDYDGNRTVDLAIYRPATGQWFVRGGSPEVVQYGADGDIALPLAAATRQAFFPR